MKIPNVKQTIEVHRVTMLDYARIELCDEFCDDGSTIAEIDLTVAALSAHIGECTRVLNELLDEYAGDNAADDAGELDFDEETQSWFRGGAPTTEAE